MSEETESAERRARFALKAQPHLDRLIGIQPGSSPQHGPSTEVATWLREIHEEIVAIGTEDYEQMGRIEAKLGQMDEKLNAICRAIGGPLSPPTA